MKLYGDSPDFHPVIRIAIPFIVGIVGALVYLSSKSFVYTQSLENIQAIDLDRMHSSTKLRNRVWRECKSVPPGTWLLHEGRVPEDAILRIGLAPKGIPVSPPEVRVYCGDAQVAGITVEDYLAWTDVRIDLARFEGQECHIVVESPVNLWLTYCELAQAQRRRPNVLVYLIDTLRPDHLSCYGYARETTPNIDALASDGVIFTEMISQSSWTRPAVASLFTSTYPSVHGVMDRADILPDEFETLPKIFHQSGYETAAFMANVTCLPMWGFGPGFRQFVDVDSTVVSGTKDAQVADSVIDALRLAKGRPWFFYVHNFGPHSPYDPPSPYNTRFVSPAACGDGPEAERAHLVDLYDGAIAFTDAQFGRIVETLKKLDRYDDTWIVVVSDHGEALFEHDEWGHGTSLYDEQIRIPCVIKPPRNLDFEGEREGIAELIDIAPTLLDLADLRVPDGFQGRSLRDRLEGAPATDRSAFSSIYLEQQNQYGARNCRAKYVYDAAAHHPVWFDLLSDPGELNALDQAPEYGASLAQFASTHAASNRSGLHILMTGGLEEDRTFEGTISGDGLGPFDLRYAAQNGEARLTDDGLTFRVATSPNEDGPYGIMEWYEAIGELNNAHLVVQVDPEEPVVATVTFDGMPIPSGMVYLGADKRHVPLNGAELRIEDIEANSDAFNPADLPSEHAVYLWYVPAVDTIDDEFLEPDMVEAMKALGYM
jgi:arylsulfatase A-like enzyme